MTVVSLDSPLYEVPCLILHSVVYRDVTRQIKGLHRLKYVGALESGLAYLSRCNLGWFCHRQSLYRLLGSGQPPRSAIIFFAIYFCNFLLKYYYFKKIRSFL
jgi:hypothetical protein